jgi:hypothetical protein
MRAAIPVALIHRRRAYLSGAARQLMTILSAEAGVSAAKSSRSYLRPRAVGRPGR